MAWKKVRLILVSCFKRPPNEANWGRLLSVLIIIFADRPAYKRLKFQPRANSTRPRDLLLGAPERKTRPTLSYYKKQVDHELECRAHDGLAQLEHMIKLPFILHDMYRTKTRSRYYQK